MTVSTTYFSCYRTRCGETATRHERLSDHGVGRYYEPYAVAPTTAQNESRRNAAMGTTRPTAANAATAKNAPRCCLPVPRPVSSVSHVARGVHAQGSRFARRIRKQAEARPKRGLPGDRGSRRAGRRATHGDAVRFDTWGYPLQTYIRTEMWTMHWNIPMKKGVRAC